MTATLTDIILKDSFTTAEALRRVRFLRDVSVNKLFGSNDTQAILKNLPASDHAWLNSLGDGVYQQFNQDNVYKFFKEAEKAIKEIQPLTVFLPFEIPPEEAARLGNTLRRSYGNNFLLEIKLDPSLIAGAAFTINGMYKDYSLRKRIDDNRQQILEAIKEHLKH
jgi:hypothetical protein